MDIEKLIDDYRKAADKWEKRHPVTDTFDLRVQDALRDAATALSTLQAENEKLRAELNDLKAQWDMYGGDEGITATFAELEQVKKKNKYSAHDVALILSDAFGDSCACNFNGNDEWLPEKCELLDTCPDVVGVACWEQYLKWLGPKKED